MIIIINNLETEALHSCSNVLKDTRKTFEEKSAEFQVEFDEQSSLLISTQSKNEELLQKVESLELQIENLKSQITWIINHNKWVNWTSLIRKVLKNIQEWSYKKFKLFIF